MRPLLLMLLSTCVLSTIFAHSPRMRALEEVSVEVSLPKEESTNQKNTNEEESLIQGDVPEEGLEADIDSDEINIEVTLNEDPFEVNLVEEEENITQENAKEEENIMGEDVPEEGFADDYDHLSCSHDEVEQDLQFYDVEEGVPTDENGQRLLASYPNIRIYPHYDLLNSAPVAFRNYAKNELIPPVVDYFKAAIKVKYPISGNLRFARSVTRFCGTPVPSVFYTGVATDLIAIFDSTYDDTSSWVASASICYLASGSKRPLAIKITMNRYFIQVANGDVLRQERDTYTMMHEMIHGLGFSKSVYKHYVDANGNTLRNHIKTVHLLNADRTVIDVPALTRKLRNFFGCANLEGAYMEEDGGSGTAGSHFERKHYYYEALSSGSIYGRRISEFSLGMLEASGWYEPDYSYAEPYFFGQGQGCGFIRDSSALSHKYEEFCQGSARGCAAHGRGGGTCSSDSKADSCRVVRPNVNWDCDNANAKNYARVPSFQDFGRGVGSKCFTGDLSTRKSDTQSSFCLKTTCSGTGTSTKLQVKVGTATVTCVKNGTIRINGYNGGIKCPDPIAFCKTVGVQYCPRNCMGRGRCQNNKCVCNRGFTGIDCGLNA